MSATPSQPARHTPQATPSASQRRSQRPCRMTSSSSTSAAMSEHAFGNDDDVAGRQHDVRLAVPALQQVADADLIFLLLAGFLVEADQLRPVARRIFGKDPDGDTRLER